MRRLRLVASDPLSGQIVSEPQSVEIVGDTKAIEYEIQEILKERKGGDDRTEYLMKWTGYARLMWEPQDALEETSALDIWEIRLEKKKKDNVTD